MILKASQRSNARELGNHLINGDSNEHVTVYEVRGFMAQDIMGALEEAYAVSRGTQCEQFLFSLSLNPPELEDVSIEDFDNAIEDIEKDLGLKGHPRIIVFHEKNGRRHCHCVWSRINSDSMTAVNMSHFKYKLKAIAKGLFLKHGWELPNGFKDDKEPKATNYALPKWQQAERLKDDPSLLKTFFQNCWQQSDNKQSFGAALQESGYYLARGDRRGYVAVDYSGEVYSLSRWLKVKTKELKAKLGDHKLLPSADQAKEFAESRMTGAMRQYLTEKRARAKEQRAPLVQELRELVEYQRKQRRDLIKQQRKRWIAETKIRVARFSGGMGGVWDLVTGKDTEIRERNKQETKQAQKRDRAEMHEMVQKHLIESRKLHKTLKFYKQQQREEEWRLKRQMAAYLNTASEPEHAIEVQTAITEQLAKLESRIAAMSGDIAAMQDALDDAMISDDMKAKIRSLIERAKETFLLKRIKREQIQHKKKQTEEHLIETQQRLFHAIQQHETLKQQQAEQQRITAINTAFHARVMSMQYSLNGVPMHKVVIADPPLDVKSYRKTLRYQSSASLVNTIKTKPPKAQVINAADLRKSTATVSEILKRAKNKSTPPPKATRQKKPHSFNNKNDRN
jgi:hypothetical protein